MSDLATAILLGIIEGLTEFIPVSSTGHLILLIDLLAFEGPKGKVFEIVIQLGAILAICWLYRAKLIRATLTAHKDAEQRWFLSYIVIAFLPAAVLGVLFHSYIKSVLFDPVVVASMLVIGGVLILLIERFKPEAKVESISEFSWGLALKIGFCQALAMIPGTSRSGATIMGALLLGVERKAATEFSFFLAIPTMLGATVYDIYKNYHHLTFEGLELIAAGFIAAFIAALLVVKWVIQFISKHGFAPFAYYRIALGSLMLYLLLAA
ncbi:MAG: undecaprenyl-diphosphate phosphatase [Rickettsiales bacterium]|nr:undecaprenyl-diphosphate phosphatase [Rickettsiales bacterium]